MFTLITSDDIFRSNVGAALYHTGSLLEGTEYFRTHSHGFELRPFSVAPGFRLDHKRLDVGRIKIDFARIDCGKVFEVIQVCDPGYYSCRIPITGSCEYRLHNAKWTLGPGQILAGNPFDSIPKRFVAPYTQAILSIEVGALNEVLAAELGHPIVDPLRFEPIPSAGPAARLLSTMVEFNWMTFDTGTAATHWRVARQLERALLVGLLRAAPHNYSVEMELQSREIAPHYVRRAEAYIRANMARDLKMEDIVEESGVSSRTLFYGFRRWRQTTPMAYLKAARLDCARMALTGASVAGGSVTDVALGVGYQYLSRFSSDYRARFGERPSDTLLAVTRQ
ncbi:AraC family transcriptional regulator [Rhizorhabdus wittichii]|uniref:AraC family transcriptional regulator n=1 Tax=Rhizorhabdus wittichii TaxID=160791 RepID=UPI0002EEF615|nr:AraC family transcriptional regulator [Rhizorhabdus wittichii]